MSARWTDVPCRRCAGRGSVDGGACRPCGGSGIADADRYGFRRSEPVVDDEGRPVVYGTLIDGGDGTVGVAVGFIDSDGDVDDYGRAVGINARLDVLWPEGVERVSLGHSARWYADDHLPWILEDWSVRIVRAPWTRESAQLADAVSAHVLKLRAEQTNDQRGQ